jgi:hypothetical protein
MSAEVKKEIQLEIGHVLFIDIVGYSTRLINEQRALRDTLNQIVRNTEQFRYALDFYDAGFQDRQYTASSGLVKVHRERGLLESVRLAGPFRESTRAWNNPLRATANR